MTSRSGRAASAPTKAARPRVARKNDAVTEPSPEKTTADAEQGSQYTISVIEKMAEVLSVFSQARPALSLKDIAQAIGMPKTTVFRILSTLVAIDFCEFDQNTGEYSLGFGLLRLAEIRRRQANVHAVALPVMREIRNAATETVVLSVRSGEMRVHIDFVEGLHPLRRITDLGVGAPLYAGAASKVLLAGMSDEEISAYLGHTPLKAFQETTITKKAELLREIGRIREQGFSESRGELFSGGGSLAAPVKDWTGHTVAAIDILTPDNRYTPEHREKCIKLLLDGTREVSARLGYRQEPAPPVPAKKRARS
jgi:DNA-binding IclR family transcriptional regulator